MQYFLNAPEWSSFPFVDPDPHFYVERAKASAGCCAVCKQFITVGQQRFGFRRHSSVNSSVASSEWVHSPRCVRKANLEIRFDERVAFDTDVEEVDRSRVLEELAAKHAHQKQVLWKGKSSNSSEKRVLFFKEKGANSEYKKEFAPFLIFFSLLISCRYFVER